jgi:GDP-4-dehydro-6-deoxy-D-mannose reductase
VRVLVTGADGFVGSHLLPALGGEGHETLATSLDGSLDARLELPDDPGAEAVVADFRPEATIHLAAISSVPAAARDPGLAWSVNVEGVRSIHRALSRHAPRSVLLHVSSGTVYGDARPGEGAADETRPCRPTSAYAWSKLAAEAWLAMAAGGGPRLIIARPFNHIGPGQSEAFAVSSFARQIAEAELTGGGEIRTGNLSARRDFLDVRDVVAAYLALIGSDRASGVFNVCAGDTRAIGDVLAELRGRTPVGTRVVADPARRRDTDADPVLGSSERLRRETGWRPHRDISETLDDLLADWRSRVVVPRPSGERSGA